MDKEHIRKLVEQMRCMYNFTSEKPSQQVSRIGEITGPYFSKGSELSDYLMFEGAVILTALAPTLSGPAAKDIDGFSAFLKAYGSIAFTSGYTAKTLEEQKPLQ